MMFILDIFAFISGAMLRAITVPFATCKFGYEFYRFCRQSRRQQAAP
jgi:hypothetical protein